MSITPAYKRQVRELAQQFVAIQTKWMRPATCDTNICCFTCCSPCMVCACCCCLATDINPCCCSRDESSLQLTDRSAEKSGVETQFNKTIGSNVEFNGFIDWLKRNLSDTSRVRIDGDLAAVRRKADHLVTSDCSPFTYLISREDLLQLENFPKHEDALKMINLVKVEIRRLRLPANRHYSPILFVSHKWIGNQCDTPTREILQMAKDRVKKYPRTQFVWFD
jgi:hypothetical protein